MPRRPERFGALDYDYDTRRLTLLRHRGRAEEVTLSDDLRGGLNAPICLTWELTYGCNLACVHCLSSSGKRDPRELETEELIRTLDELRDLQVFYINVGGGEPLIRKDFEVFLDAALERGIGVKFSTNGAMLTESLAERLASTDYVDVQISLDGADALTNDAVRGKGSYGSARRAMDRLQKAGFGPFKISIVLTRHNVGQLQQFEDMASDYGAQLRVTRLRPSGRGADTWHELRLTAAQQRETYQWLAERPDVLTGDSFFHLGALGGEGGELPGLNLCGAGRVVCLIDPVGDVYACPFVMHEEFKAGNVRDDGGFTRVWREAELFEKLRAPEKPEGACASCSAYKVCGGGCIAAKFYTGLPLAGPDPECVFGHGETALEVVPAGAAARPGPGHSKPVRVRTPCEDPERVLATSSRPAARVGG